MLAAKRQQDAGIGRDGVPCFLQRGNYCPCVAGLLLPWLAGALLDPEAIDIGELKHRLLAMQALETVRCLEEKVLTDVREADVGSILGFGFAPFSGGTLSYIDGMGAPAFLALCKSLEKKHGPRFKAGKLLRDMARNNETFYGRFAPRAGAQAA